MHKQYSPAILPLLQSLLATLADIDFAHECELERLGSGSGDPSVKERVRSTLKAEHRQRREPYVQQVALLEGRIRDAMLEDRESRQAA